MPQLVALLVLPVVLWEQPRQHVNDHGVVHALSEDDRAEGVVGPGVSVPGARKDQKTGRASRASVLPP